jgi:hypothetical protein
MRTFFKFAGGLLLVVTGLGALVLGISYWRFGRMVEDEVKDLYGDAGAGRQTVVTEAMLQDLPAPIQRYLRHAGVVGKPIVRTVRLQQEGKFRTGVDQPWMRIRANEYYTVDKPGFIWDATFYQNGLPLLRVRDSYRDGRGHILGKVGGLFTMLEDKGEGVDQGTLMRYLQEMTWFPSAFLRDNITFAPIDDESAQVTLTDQGRQVTGTMYIDAEGNFVNFVGQRYRNIEDGYGTWTTPIDTYGDYAGLQLPASGRGVWRLPEGDLEYIDVAATKIEFDVPQVFTE